MVSAAATPLIPPESYSRSSSVNSREEASFNRRRKKNGSLSLFYATLCVIDLFGVFPIVALPSSIISCGLYGIPLVLFVITLQIYTAVILGRCWIIAEKVQPSIVQKNRYPYAAIAEMTYGRGASVFVTVLLDLTVFGAGIPNLLMASQNMQLLGARISDGEFNLSFCIWLIIIGVFLCPLMWLGSPKNMKELATVSVITTSSVALLTWYCMITDPKDRTEQVKYSGYPPFENLLKAYGIIAFQFDIHPMLLTIEVDMEKKQKIGRAVTYGILVTVSLAAITTMIAICQYGNQTPANVLEILPRSVPLYITILLVTLQLCISNAIGTSALFQHLEDLLSASRDFTFKRCLIRSTLVCLAVLLGELLPKFDIVMGVIGGTLTGPLIFILPPLFHTRMLKLEREFNARNEKDPLEGTSTQYPESIERLEEVSMSYSYGAISYDMYHTPKTSSLGRLWRKLVKWMRLLYSDCVLLVIVVGFGLIATFTSTFFSFPSLKGILMGGSCINNLTRQFEL